MDSRQLKHIGIIATFATVAVLPIVFQGIPGGNDLPHHLLSAQNLRASLISGDLFPAFASEINHGFGDVSFRFYPPLSYYLVNLLFAILGSWSASFASLYLLTFFAGGVGVYFWVTRDFDPMCGLTAAGLYTFSPYHLNEIYNSGLFGEFTASAILPFCFLFANLVARRPLPVNIICLAISVSTLILTNLPIAIIGISTLAIYILFLAKTCPAKLFPRFSISALFAMALSAFFWMRLVTEMSWLKHTDEKYFSGVLSHRNNFLFDPATLLNFNQADLAIWLANAMLLVSIFGSLSTAALLIGRRIECTDPLRRYAIALLTCVLMTTPLTSLIWDYIPILQKVQFPWRWMIMVSMFGAVFASVGIVRLGKEKHIGMSALILVGLPVLFIVFVSVFIVRSPSFTPHNEFGTVAPNVGTESYEAWWPTWANREAFSQTTPVEAGNRQVSVTMWAARERIFIIGEGSEADAAVATFFYPHWRGTVNGSPIEVWPSEKGTIKFKLPAEKANVTLTFEEPWFLRLAGLFSALCWLAAVFYVAGRFIRPHVAFELKISG